MGGERGLACLRCTLCGGPPRTRERVCADRQRWLQGPALMCALPACPPAPQDQVAAAGKARDKQERESARAAGRAAEQDQELQELRKQVGAGKLPTGTRREQREGLQSSVEWPAGYSTDHS